MSEKVRRGGGAECAALQARVPCGMPSALAGGGCGSFVHCCVAWRIPIQLDLDTSLLIENVKIF